MQEQKVLVLLDQLPRTCFLFRRHCTSSQIKLLDYWNCIYCIVYNNGRIWCSALLIFRLWFIISNLTRMISRGDPTEVFSVLFWKPPLQFIQPPVEWIRINFRYLKRLKWGETLVKIRSNYDQYYCFRKQIFLLWGSPVVTAVRPVPPVPDSRRPFCNHCSRPFSSRPFCHRRLRQAKVTRMYIIISINYRLLTDMMVMSILLHGLGGPTRMSAPGAPTSLIRSCV